MLLTSYETCFLIDLLLIEYLYLTFFCRKKYTTTIATLQGPDLMSLLKEKKMITILITF